MRFLSSFRQWVYETPADQGQAFVAPAEPAAVATPPEPPAQPPAGDAPWASDLEEYFEDPNARAAADRYLREKWQPHTTQLQQQLADLTPAGALYNDLLADPNGTFQEIAAELYADQPEVAARIQEILAGPPPPQDPATPPTAPSEDPVIAEMKASYEAQKQQEQYEAQLARIQGPDPENPAVKPDLFHPFVVANHGDFDAALAAYKVWEGQVRTAFDTTPPPPPAPGAPVALGSAGSDGAVPPPIAPKFATLDEAMDSAMDDMRAARAAPTAVGSV